MNFVIFEPKNTPPTYGGFLIDKKTDLVYTVNHNNPSQTL